MSDKTFVSRAGGKLDYALDHFNIDVSGLICADFGCSTGGFTDCLLQRGASKVYAIDTAYGELDWKLRNNPQVVVMERQNVLYVNLPEKVDFICIDTGWTKQSLVAPVAINNLKSESFIISLLKPHYEADKRFLKAGKVIEERIQEVVSKTVDSLKEINIKVIDIVESPIEGKKGGNKEFLMLLGN
jgi:23S rRNA (cytidine1920-2'-O)/16S rRNA (cytidine1409-2'-O)-methyltransferase